MTEIKFTETDVPDVVRAGRPKEPNPYQAVVDRLGQDVRTKDSDGVALTLTVPAIDGKDDAAAVSSALRKMREAGREAGLTIRTDDAHNNGRKITVWAIPLVRRERKPKDAA